MESLWMKTEKKLMENGEKLNKDIETEVCIIGGRYYRNKYRILLK